MKEVQRRRSSLYSKARASFFRSHGERGANVETLRGSTGSDFEGDIEICRGANKSALCSCFSKSSKPKPCYILMKGPSVFVFATKSSSSPKYAIKVDNIDAKIQHSHEKHVLVTLENSLGDVEYQLYFSDRNEAAKFSKVIGEQSAIAQQIIVKKQLGHHHLINHKSSSVKYSEAIANEKVKDQPEKPLSIPEVLQTIPQTPY